MPVQNVGAQSLRPVVNFKAEPEAAESKTEKKTSTGKIVGWTVAGAAALAAITWGVIALRNRSQAGKAKEAAKTIFNQAGKNSLATVDENGLKTTIYFNPKTNKPSFIAQRDKDGKLIKNTKMLKNGSLTTTYLNDGGVFTKFVGKDGMVTTKTKAKDGFTMIQVSKNNQPIGSISYKDGKIINSDNINGKFDESGKFTYEVLS